MLEKFDGVCVKESNRVEQEDYISCWLESKLAEMLSCDWVGWAMDCGRMTQKKCQVFLV